MTALLVLAILSADEPSCDSADECRTHCEAGELEACTAQARMLIDDDHRAEGMRIYERVCRLKAVSACDGLAYQLTLSGNEAEQTRAIALYSETCSRDDALGCTNAALVLNDLPGAEVKTAELADKGCKLGDFYACNLLAGMYSQGKGVAKSEERAVSLWSQACDGDQRDACFELALYFSRQDDRNAHHRAVTLLSAACDDEDAFACFELSAMVRKGRGTRRDRLKAGQLTGRACSLQYAPACPRGVVPDEQPEPEDETGTP